MSTKEITTIETVMLGGVITSLICCADAGANRDLFKALAIGITIAMIVFPDLIREFFPEETSNNRCKM